MQKPGLDGAQAGIKTAGRKINNLRYADDNTLIAESKEELKSLLMKVKEDSENAGLKLNTQKIKIMASSPISSWQIDGEKMETVTDCIFLDSKLRIVTAAIKLKYACSLKNYDKPRQCTKKWRHYFADRGLSSQRYGFSSSHVYGCESWTIKKAVC